MQELQTLFSYPFLTKT